jgi:hypothetical protein
MPCTSSWTFYFKTDDKNIVNVKLFLNKNKLEAFDSKSRWYKIGDFMPDYIIPNHISLFGSSKILKSNIINYANTILKSNKLNLSYSSYNGSSVIVLYKENDINSAFAALYEDTKTSSYRGNNIEMINLEITEKENELTALKLTLRNLIYELEY